MQAPAIADNPAVTTPRKDLTRAERRALAALGHFATSSRVPGGFRVGDVTVSMRTATALCRKGLAGRRFTPTGRAGFGVTRLTITLAGELALAALSRTARAARAPRSPKPETPDAL